MFHKREAHISQNAPQKNSQSCSITLHTPFDERYKINGSQGGEAEVLEARGEQDVKWANNCGKKRTKNTCLCEGNLWLFMVAKDAVWTVCIMLL